MPTYEYQCAKCNKRHEASQSITAKPLVTCPKCGGRLKRLISSGSGFLFRGGGFYITDYRSKSYQEAKKKDEQSKSSSSSSGSDSKSSHDAKKKDQPASSSDGKSSSSTGSKA